MWWWTCDDTEYDAGHIPGAILIPNESIETEPPAELPDPDQIILVYCRSGNRGKQAAEKLGKMGYRNVYEFGGIINWTGDVVTSEQEAMVRSTPSLVIQGFDRSPFCRFCLPCVVRSLCFFLPAGIL